MAVLKILGLMLVVAVCYAIAQGTNAAAAVATVVVFIGSLVLYFCPTILAVSRKHPRATSIVVVNIFLGWTLVGWVVSLAWAQSVPAGGPAAPPAPAPAEPVPDDWDAMGAASRNQARTVAAVAPPTAEGTRLCPFCAEEVKLQAIKCKHCGSDIGAAKLAT